MTFTRSLPSQSEDAPPPSSKRLGLSWTQIAAAGFASITATVILSFFSLRGTLIGAAVFSMASAIGNAVYGQSLRKTQDTVLNVLPVGKSDPASPTIVLDVTDVTGAEHRGEHGADAALDRAPALPAAPATAATPLSPATLSPNAWKRIAITAVTVFAFVIAVVTSVELIAGKPLTDVLRGEQGSGTSFFNPTSGTGGGAAPTVTVTVTPSVVFTTPTVTQTAPAVTVSPSPTDTPTTPAGGTGSATTPADTGSATGGTPSPSQSSSP